MLARREGDEELRSVGVFPGVAHRDHAPRVVPALQTVLLVLELLAPDALPAAPVLHREVPALHHEPLDHAVELDPLVVVGNRAVLAHALLASAQRLEVLHRQRRLVVEQLDDHPLLRRGLDLDRSLGSPVEVVRVALDHALLLATSELGDVLASPSVAQVGGLDEVPRALVLLPVGVEVDVEEHPRVWHVGYGPPRSTDAGRARN